MRRKRLFLHIDEELRARGLKMMAATRVSDCLERTILPALFVGSPPIR
jgi:hypothetical protein